MQQHLFERFQSPGQTGFIEDVSVTLIDKANPFIPTKYEDYWRQTLKTLAPQTLKKVYNASDHISYFCPDFSSYTLFQTALIRTTIFWIYTVVTWLFLLITLVLRIQRSLSEVYDLYALMLTITTSEPPSMERYSAVVGLSLMLLRHRALLFWFIYV